MPVVAEGASSFTCEVRDFRSLWVKNELSYPHAATLYMEVPVNGIGSMMDVFWYEGGIKPKTPAALVKKGIRMPEDGVMFVGEQGTILTDYGYENAVLLDVRNEDLFRASVKVPPSTSLDQTDEMIAAFRGGKPSGGNFESAQTVAEAICLGNLAIRMDDRLEWDNVNMKVTNLPAANKYLSRVYRKGWEL